MSEFYKEKRNLIIKNFKYLGVREMVSFYVFRSFMMILAVILCSYLIQLVNLENIEEACIAIPFLALFTFISYIASENNNRKHQEDKIGAVIQFVREPDVNISIIGELIGEIERYIKRIKTFATWITGLSATFIILWATLATNFFIRIFDVYLKMAPTDELVNMIEIIGSSRQDNELIFKLFDVGGTWCLVFIIVILIFYNLFAMFTFVKKQILIFLFDVRYEMLLEINQNDS